MSETSSTGRAPKGRPTPKRSEARRSRPGPVAAPPRNRKEAAKRQREQGAERRREVRQGTLAGDERYLSGRDAGPVRRAVRDLVDSRRSSATLLLPAAVLPLLGNLTGDPRIRAAAFAMWLAALVVAVVDFSAVAARTQRMLKADFPGEKGRGHVFYAILRTLQFRRLRLPKPAVSPPPLRR